MRAVKALIAVMALTLLAGCFGDDKPFTILQGECKVFTDPGFAVQGKRTKDKRWIGATQEKGIKVCGWLRPTAP